MNKELKIKTWQETEIYDSDYENNKHQIMWWASTNYNDKPILATSDTKEVQ